MPQLLAVGNEGEWCQLQDAFDATTGVDDKRRGAVKLVSGAEMFAPFGVQADLWAHYRALYVNYFGGFETWDPVQILTDAGTVLMRLRPVHETNVARITLRFEVLAADGLSYVDTGIRLQSSGGFNVYDLNIRTSTTTTANDTIRFRLWRDQQLRGDITVVYDAAPSAARSVMLRLHGSEDAWYQDVIITDGIPTVGAELAYLPATAAGTQNDFANDYTSVTAQGYDPSTGITIAGAGSESWLINTSGVLLGDKSIYGLVFGMVAQAAADGSVTDFKGLVRSGGVNYVTPNAGFITESPQHIPVVFETNPANGQPWSLTSLNGAEIGVQSAV